MQEPDTDILKDGDDSPAVSEKVKRQLLSDGLGICATPNCDNRVDVQKTRLGECAHIIPKKVGSHPREDYSTPLEDRAKEENLLYLCEKHHKIVDNKVHANIYTADSLRTWKRGHESWAVSVTKKSPYIPKEQRDDISNLVSKFQQDVANLSDVSTSIITKLISTCKELVSRQLIDEARTLLSQIDLFLIDAESDELTCQADTLNALILVRSEQICGAKTLLLETIKRYPHELSPMLEYIELCDSIPEPCDEKDKFETIARTLDKNNPRLLLIDYNRMIKKGEAPEVGTIPEQWASDLRLNARLTCQKSLFSDLEGKYKERDDLIDRWESSLPASPRSNLFKVLYKTNDTFRNKPEKEQLPNKLQLEEATQFSSDERTKTETKDPLALRDQISWRMQEMRLILAQSHLSKGDYNLASIRDDLVNLIVQCYFDQFINDILKEFLSSLILEPNQWQHVVERIRKSNVKVSPETSELLFTQALQYDELVDDLSDFVKFIDSEDLDELWVSLKERNVEKSAVRLNAINKPIFSLTVLRSIPDQNFQLQLIDLLNIAADYQQDILYARIDALARSGQDKEALDLIPSLPIEKASSSSLSNILSIANKNQRWDLFIPPAVRLLEIGVSPSHKTELDAQLAFAYHEQGDDSNAIEHAEQAIAYHKTLGDQNSQMLLHLLGQALLLKGLANQACEMHEKYRGLKRSFPLLLEEVDLLLKSTLEDKYDRALSRIKEAFQSEESYDGSLFLSAFMLLVELGNANQIRLENETTIEDGLFVKLDGFQNGWFYIGPKEESMGAECISKGTVNYDSLINKKISDLVEWPADKFSGSNVGHKIIYIVTFPAYLSQRAHEAMENAARMGNAPIWSVKVINEDGSLDLENLNNFYKDQFSDNRAFFEKYISSTLPFSFLCRMEGSLIQAIGKITSEKKGFIRCNNSTQAEIDLQKSAAIEALNGTPCVIDGLSALVLAEMELLNTVVDSLPNLFVCTSVIRLLRQIASKFESSEGSEGRASFINGNFQYRSIDKEAEISLKTKLLSAADILDALPNKVVSKDYSKSDNKEDLDHIFPDYFVGAFRLAQEKKAILFTDDALIVQAYKLSGEDIIPRQFSSISLARGLVDSGVIKWSQYLDYFSLLSSYRYHLLPISVDDLLCSVLPSSDTGLVSFSPRNILKLNLRLTLSEEYGVKDDVVIRILASFFTKIILDESITHQMAKEIFKITIVESLEKRNQRLLARIIFLVCQNNMPEENWLSQSVIAKLKKLDKQFAQYVQERCPIIVG